MECGSNVSHYAEPKNLCLNRGLAASFFDLLSVESHGAILVKQSDMLRIMNNQKHYWLYALKLEQGKYYVGITSLTPEARFKQHLNGFLGAEWTKLYKPIKIIQEVDLGVTTFEKAEAYENKVTRKYIKEYGLSNVRGGDIRYRGKYVLRFGYAYTDKDWKEIIYNLMSLGFVLYVLIDLIFDKKILSPLFHLLG